jgi:hypothetical protein
VRWIEEVERVFESASHYRGRMSYEIRYLKRGVAETENWHGSFEEAKGLAQAAVASGDYDHAEVWDDDGLRFHCPRVTRPSQS